MTGLVSKTDLKPEHDTYVYQMADTTPRNTGRVKWFNNKAGYGFITWNPSAGAESEDIFVHHSALTTEKDQFRYLVEGEYVTFSVSTTSDKTTASNVTGPDGGKLMCETRRERREQNDERRAARPSNESSESSYRKKTSTFRGGGPRSGQTNERILVQMADQDDGTVWELVRRGKGGNNRCRKPNRRPRELTTTEA